MFLTNIGFIAFTIVCLLNRLTYGIDANKSQPSGNATVTSINLVTNPSAAVPIHTPASPVTSPSPVVLINSSDFPPPPVPTTLKPHPDPEPAPTIKPTTEPPSNITITPVPTPNVTTQAPSTSSITPSSSIPSTTSSVPPITLDPTKTTTTRPTPSRQFDGPSFVGGIILTTGLMAISFVALKFYRARTERNYHTL